MSEGLTIGCLRTHRCQALFNAISKQMLNLPDYVATHTHYTRLASALCAMPPPHARWVCHA